MKRILAGIFLFGIFFGAACIDAVQAEMASAAPDAISNMDALLQTPFKPDRELVLALIRNDKTAVGRLLDDEFLSLIHI